MIVIRARDVRKRYGKVNALDGVSIDVRQGEILGILGPNGAGKTTFLNVLATLLLPDSGDIHILNIPLLPENFTLVRRIIGMSSGYPNYPWVMTVEENLRFYGRLYGLKGKQLQGKVREVMAIFELEQFSRRRFDELSSGLKQRLSLAKSLLNDPQIIFLDEPTIGLDPDVALKTRAIILDTLKKRGVTVLLTSHNMDEVQAMCDRVAFIKKGRILKLATVHELKRLHNTEDLEQVFIALAQSSHAPGAPLQEDCFPMASACVTTQDYPVAAWINRAFAFTARNATFAVRNLFVMTDVFFWPLVSLLSIGLMTRFVDLGQAQSAFIITGTIAAGILQIVQLDVGYAVLYDLWSKSLKHTLLTPVGLSEGICGSWIIGIFRGLIVFVFLSAAAGAWFGFMLPDPLTTVVFLAGLFICALLLGMFVNFLILSFGQKVEITAWMFAHLFMIVCGIYYPVTILPGWAKAIAAGIPMTYFLEYIRQPYGFFPSHTQLLFKGFGLTAIYYAAGLVFLKSAYTRARQRGTIIRMSE